MFFSHDCDDDCDCMLDWGLYRPQRPEERAANDQRMKEASALGLELAKGSMLTNALLAAVRVAKPSPQ